MKHFWQFLIIAISRKYVGRRLIHFVTAPRDAAFHSPAIFAVLHWSFVFKHRTLLCCCLILVTTSVERKSKDRSFWWRSLHEVHTSQRCMLNDQWQQYSNYSCTRILVDGPPTRVRVSKSLLALLTYEYPGGYGLSWKQTCHIIIIIAFKGAIRDFLQSPHGATNCLQHVRSSGPGAIECKSCATHRALITCKCHVTCHLVRRDSSAIKSDRIEITFIWALFYCLNHYTDERGEETGVPGENPWWRASENATYYSPKIQAPSETWTRAVALVAG